MKLLVFACLLVVATACGSDPHVTLSGQTSLQVDGERQLVWSDATLLVVPAGDRDTFEDVTGMTGVPAGPFAAVTDDVERWTLRTDGDGKFTAMSDVYDDGPHLVCAGEPVDEQRAVYGGCTEMVFPVSDVTFVYDAGEVRHVSGR